MKDDLSTLVWVVDNASALWVSRSRRRTIALADFLVCWILTVVKSPLRS
jgi:hypothetical protein